MREQFWNLIGWTTEHFGLVLFLLTFLVAFTYVSSAAVLSLWQVSEGRRQAEERARLNRALKASETEDINLKLLRASRPTRASGFKRTRVG